MDAGHGAAYRVAPLVFDELGAQVTALGVEPNGLNINEGAGALHPAQARRPRCCAAAPRSASRSTATPTA